MSDRDIRPVPFRGGGFRPRRMPVITAVFFICLLALWAVGSRTGFIGPLTLPPPGDVLASLARLIETGDLWRHLSASLFRLGAGWTIGVTAGVALGLAVGLFSVARAMGMPVVSALFPIPKIALLPLFIIWFGIGEPSKVATIAFGVFFPTVIHTAGGVANVPRSLIAMGQSFGLSPWRIMTRIVLPGALPAILTGFRVSASIGIILLVAAEMIGAQYGLGALVLAAGNLMQTDLLIAGVVVLSLLGLIVAGLLGLIEKRLLRWR
ncbi:ABC transporter permease [Tistrella bauzanensis]|uniref:ABC transporter permease n=1 Tax=Tistrella bauzanensis TaxID=657419 RepID=A0ABQ1IA16_9PROT|nr:ABC transporter permease [Tistrella bauzanensis]GGB23748.1 ABC transporter permease [Tistrella bauzanensis]